MLADLKAERDLLKRSLDDLISRYNDQEKQISALGRRLDNEKRDGWVSKEKLARAEADKHTVVKENEDLNEELVSLKLQLQTARAQAQAEKELRLKSERELYAALDVQEEPTSPYPYPTSYRRMQDSIDSRIQHQPQVRAPTLHSFLFDCLLFHYRLHNRVPRKKRKTRMHRSIRVQSRLFRTACRPGSPARSTLHKTLNETFRQAGRLPRHQGEPSPSRRLTTSSPAWRTLMEPSKSIRPWECPL